VLAAKVESLVTEIPYLNRKSGVKTVQLTWQQLQLMLTTW